MPTPPATPASIDDPPPSPGGGDRRASGAAPPPRRRSLGWRSKDVLRTAALVLAMYVVVRLLWIANQLVLAVFLGVLFGLAVSAGADRLERIGLRRGIGAPLIVFGFFGMLVLFGIGVAPTLREQGTELRRKLPQAIERVEQWTNEQRGGIMGVFLGGSRSPDSVAMPPGVAVAPPVVTPATPSSPRADTAAAASLRERIGAQLAGATRYLFPFLSSTVAVLAGLLLIVFLAIYTAAEPALYHRGLMHLFPHASRKRAGEVLSAIATVLRRWLVTQLIAMAVIGTVTTTVLLILDVKPAFALGLIAGLLEFVPTIGPILSAVPAIAMGFLDSPEKALYVMIAYIVIQFAENQLLIPLLMKGGVDLPPAVTIVSQALMALLFGFLGLMVAVPGVAAVMVAVNKLYVEGVVGDNANHPDALTTAEHARPDG